MAYEVPDLPYDYGALDPHIDEQTMRVHHDKHHQAYVDKANAALDRGAPGTYNVVDDDPAMLREWLPAYADAVDARPPRRVPRFVARLVAGKFGLYMTTQLQGATNAKAKRELGWQPRWASWRDGFREALG